MFYSGSYMMCFRISLTLCSLILLLYFLCSLYLPWVSLGYLFCSHSPLLLCWLGWRPVMDFETGNVACLLISRICCGSGMGFLGFDQVQSISICLCSSRHSKLIAKHLIAVAGCV
ncbi:hypothetical protein BJX68DRAFT_79336 [Aspergillus pseudodeflectus]|uniref:Uncharacterized protein n=1 Tax=Aspergillus pseudodeflectus TaxID=176178 RepID=A0ABR4L9K9_9EURO